MNSVPGTTLALLALTACAHPVRAQSDALDAFGSYQAHLAAAEKSLQLDQSRELRRWLDHAPETYRGWEWDYLDSISDRSSRTVTAGETPIRIAISPQGDRVATVEGNRVVVRGWPTLEPLSIIADHDDAIYRAEFSPDGTRLVTVARDVTSRVWDLESGTEQSRIELANPAVAAATFSPDGRRVATCAWERVEGEVYGVIWIWNAVDGTLEARERVGDKPLSAIRYTPDGNRLLTCSWDGLVHLLDPNGVEQGRLTLPDEGIYNAANDIAITPDGRLVAAASKDRTIRVFDIESGELRATLRGHDGYVEGLAFSPDGTRLASSSADRTLRLWRTSDWSPAGTLRGHGSNVRGVVWTPDGTSLISCCMDGELRVWDAGRRYEPQFDIQTGADGIYTASFGAHDRTIAVACYDGSLRIFAADTGEQVAEWEAHAGSTCHAADFDARGSRLITCSWAKTARVWDMSTHEQIAELEAGKGVYSATLSADGNRAALAAGELLVFDVDTAQLVHRIAVEGASPRHLAFSPDGSLLAAGWSDGLARVCEVDRGEWIASLDHSGSQVESVAFTADGESIVSGDSKGVVRRFPARGGKAAFACDVGERSIHRVAVAGDRIAVATDRLWLIDLVHGGAVLERQLFADSVYHLTWSSDGRRIAACTIPGTVTVLGETD